MNQVLHARISSNPGLYIHRRANKHFNMKTMSLFWQCVIFKKMFLCVIFKPKQMHIEHVRKSSSAWRVKFCLEKARYVLAYQTRFSAIFTSADKSYLTYTYPYPTLGIDKIKSQHVLSIHWLYRRSHNSVFKMLGVDVIVTSYTMSTFNMADVKV